MAATRLSLLSLMLWTASAQSGEVYRWVDEDGVVHFSQHSANRRDEQLIVTPPPRPTPITPTQSMRPRSSSDSDTTQNQTSRRNNGIIGKRFVVPTGMYSGDEPWVREAIEQCEQNRGVDCDSEGVIMTNVPVIPGSRGSDRPARFHESLTDKKQRILERYLDEGFRLIEDRGDIFIFETTVKTIHSPLRPR